MTTWHVDFTDGNDANPGTSQGSAKVTLQAAADLAGSGDTIQVYGKFRPRFSEGASAFNALTFPLLTDPTNLTINFNDVIIYGNTDDFTGTIGTWTPIGGSPDCYEEDIGTGFYIDAVINDFDNTGLWYEGTNGTLLPNRDFTWVASRATVLTTDYSWFYDSGTGIFSFNTGGESPLVEICRGRNAASVYQNPGGGLGTAEYQGIHFSNPSNLTLTGTLTIYNINKFSISSGYGFYCNSPTNLDASGLTLEIQGTGYHSLGIAGAGSSNNVHIGNFTLGTISDISTHIVAFGSGNDETLDDLIFGDNSEIHQVPHLKPDNTPARPYYTAYPTVRSGVSSGAFYYHTNASANNLVLGIKFRNIDVYGYGYVGMTLGGGNNTAAYTGDVWDETGRIAVYENITYYNGTGVPITGSPLYKDCRFFLDQAGPTNQTYIGAFIIYSPDVLVIPCKPLFVNCIITANCARPAAAYSFIFGGFDSGQDFAAGDGYYFKNCSIMDETSNVGTSDITMLHWITLGVGAKMQFHARATLFGFRYKTTSTTLCGGDSSVNAAGHDFEGCAYVGIRNAANGYSENAALDTQSEWSSLVDDVGSVYDAAYANLYYVNADTGEISASSILNVPNTTSPQSNYGINDALNSGAIGPWQFGKHTRGLGPLAWRLRPHQFRSSLWSRSLT